VERAVGFNIKGSVIPQTRRISELEQFEGKKEKSFCFLSYNRMRM
jgi:hypothetical protein